MRYDFGALRDIEHFVWGNARVDSRAPIGKLSRYEGSRASAHLDANEEMTGCSYMCELNAEILLHLNILPKRLHMDVAISHSC